MKQFLFSFALVLMVSITAIGFPTPDHLSPDIGLILSSDLTNQSDSLVRDFTAKTEANQLTKANLIFTEQEAVSTHLFLVNSKTDFGDSDFASLISPINIEVLLGDEIVEDTKKPKDRYRMPKWEYQPIIEPPRTVSHVS